MLFISGRNLWHHHLFFTGKCRAGLYICFQRQRADCHCPVIYGYPGPLLQGERLRGRFLVGFFVAIIGISLITFNGSFILKLNPLGDFFL
jgi:hypothetical protein